MALNFPPNPVNGDVYSSDGKTWIYNSSISAWELEVIDNKVVYLTGDQLISGVKTFVDRPFVNGTGVMLSGEAAPLPTTIVYQTGDQNISGVKTFVNNALFSSNVGIGTTSPAAKLDISDTTGAASGSLAASALNIAQTWNTTGAPAAIKLNVTDTASNSASRLIDLRVGGVTKFSVGSSSVFIPTSSNFSCGRIDTSGVDHVASGTTQYSSSLRFGSASSLAWMSGSTWASGSPDLILFRDAAGILAQRNGTNAQSFRLYNTYTDASNYERGFFRWNTNVLQIGAEALGTGTNRNLEFVAGGSTRMTLTSGGDVGVGTTTPVGSGITKLHIAGNGGGTNQYGSISLSNESGSGNNIAGAIDYYTQGNLIASIRSKVVGGGNTGELNFLLASSGTLTHRLRINSSGNIIASNSEGWGGSGAKFDVEANGSGSATRGLNLSNLTTPNNSAIEIGFRSYNASGQEKDFSVLRGLKISNTAGNEEGGLAIYTTASGSSTEKFRISGSGNVGIGTTTPEQLLHVNGTIKAYSSLRFQVNAEVRSESTGGGQSLKLIGCNGTPNGFIDLIPSTSASSTGEYVRISGGPSGTTEIARFLGTGNVGIGTSTPSEKLTVAGNVSISGHLSAATKSFKIPHQTKSGYLQYGVVESNEHSVYVRGESSKDTITLPDHWEWLVDENSITVQLTSVGKFMPLYIIDKNNKKVTIGGVEGNYNYTIYGTRKDVPDLIVETEE